MMHEKPMPVLVGVGQLTNRSRDPQRAGDPDQYMVCCAREAAADAGSPDALARLDSISVINVLSGGYHYQPGRVAGELGASPSDQIYTTIGATSPQVAITRLCHRIASGQSEMGLVCGAENFHTGAKPDWERIAGETYEDFPHALLGDRRNPVTALEQRYGLHYPAVVYPLFANAFRKARGLSMDGHCAAMARLCERLSTVASRNPHAWFSEPRRAQEIAAVTAHNRMAHFPFTKYMNAMINVDQAAAVLVMSEARADALCIPAHRRVYLAGSSEVNEKWHLSLRRDFHTAPALAEALKLALGRARTEARAIHHWDLYSCFPVTAQMAMEAVDLPPDVPPTVIGGLPYFGGPGNHYSLHAICEMVRLLRRSPEQRGLVHCLSWHLHKYAVGIYTGTRPQEHRVLFPDPQKDAVERQYPDKVVLERAAGAFEIETYVVSFDRQGAPTQGTIIATNEEGQRAFAVNRQDAALLLAMTREEPIGHKAELIHDASTGLNHFTCR